MVSETVALKKGDRQRRPVNRRVELLQAAAARLVEGGSAAVSIRDIATDVAMQPGSIYYHFPSKAALLEAVYEEGMRLMTEAVGSAIAKVAGPWPRLEAACIAHLAMLLEGGVFPRASMRHLPGPLPRSQTRIIDMRDAYENVFVRLLDDLPLPMGTDRRKLRLLLMGAMNWSFTWYKPGIESPENIAREFVAMLRTGLDIGDGNAVPPPR